MPDNYEDYYGDNHQQDPYQQDSWQEPPVAQEEPEEVEVVEEYEVPSEPTGTKIPDPGRVSVSEKGHDLTWDQAESVVSFSFAYMNMPETDRDKLSDLVLGRKDRAHPVILAKELYPSGGFVDSLEQFSNISSKFLDGNQPSFMDGLEFHNYLSESDANTIRTFCTITNAFSEEGAKDLTYRANMNMDVFIGQVLNVLQNEISPESRESASRISELLKIWPLQKDD